QMSRKEKRSSGRWARATCSIQSAICASLGSGSAFPSLRLLKSYKRLQFNGMFTSMGSQTPRSAPVTSTNAATKSSPIYLPESWRRSYQNRVQDNTRKALPNPQAAQLPVGLRADRQG